MEKASVLGADRHFREMIIASELELDDEN